MQKAEKILKIIAICLAIATACAIIIGIIIGISQPKNKAKAAIFTKSSANTISNLIYNINTIFTTEWIDINGEFTGLTSFQGRYIWTANGIFYYSDTTRNYKLTNNNWETVTTFTELINGEYVWTDGTDVYYSADTTQYIFDNTTEQWTTMQWNGRTSFYGSSIWRRNEEILLNTGAETYRKAGDTWELASEYNANIPINAEYIFSDGENFYYADNDNDCYLEGYTWTSQANPNPIDGTFVWTDGTNIYYSNDTSQLIYEQATNTWTEVTWTPINITDPKDIWTDGTEIYYSNNQEQYKLKKANNTYNITVQVTNGTWQGNTEIAPNGNANIQITPSNGYKLPTIIQVTNANYTYNNQNGIITLSNPTGNVTVKVICTIKTTYNISVNIVNGTYTGTTEIEENKSQTIKITANQGYELPINITVQNANYSYNTQTGEIYLYNPTANVIITAICAERQIFNITTNITNGRYNGATQIAKNGFVKAQIIPNTNYLLPTTIEVTGAQYVYYENGLIELNNPTNDIKIIVTCYSIDPEQRYLDGKQEGEAIGYQNGYNTGYNKGYSEGTNDKNTFTFSKLMDSIAFAPIKTLYSLLNFEILGVNVFDFLTALLTLGLALMILKIFL